MTYGICKRDGCDDPPRTDVRGLDGHAKSFCSDDCRVKVVYGGGGE